MKNYQVARSLGKDNKYIQLALAEQKKDLKRIYSKKNQVMGIAKYYYDSEKGFRKARGGEYAINVDELPRILILGKTGSGKTFSLRRMLSTFSNSNIQCVVIPDLKDEFKSSIYPLQLELRHLLAKNEKTHSLPIIAIRPSFFEDKPTNNLIAALPFSSLTKNAMLLLCGVKRDQKDYDTVLNVVYDLIKNKKIQQFRDLTLLKNNKQLKTISSKIIEKIISRLEDINKSGIFSDKKSTKTVNLKDLFAANKIPVLNLKNYERYGHEDGPGHMLVALWLREIFDLIQDHEVKTPIALFIDEVERWDPAVGNPVSKFVIEEGAAVMRGFGVIIVYGTQQWKKLGTTVKKSSQFVLLPYNWESKEMVEVFDTYGLQPAVVVPFKNASGETLLRNRSWTSTNKIEICSYIKKLMKKFDWLAIDTNGGGFTIYTPFAPLTLHKQTV